MRREELELKINDAADGLLNASELRRLEKTLEQHPDLLHDYRDIMGLPNLSKAYGIDSDAYQNDLKVHQIRNKIDRIQRPFSSFEETSLVWFRKYALAASLLIFALTSLFYIMELQYEGGVEMRPDEFIYPYEESSADAYVHYLNEWLEQ